MNLTGVTLLSCIGSYLLGGLPIGLIVGRLKGIDILHVGSGNIGAANVGRHLGFRWGLTVFVLDTLKGLVPTVLAGVVVTHGTAGDAADNAWGCVAWLVIGLCTVLGHNYSPYLRFRGGKGVATSLGVTLGVYPHLTVPALIGLCVWAGVVGLTRISSAGSISAAVSFPTSYALITWMRGWNEEPRWPFMGFALLVAAMVVVRHRANFRRLIAGTEARLWQDKSART